MKKFSLFIVFIFFSLSAFAYDRIVCLSPSGAEIVYALGMGEKVVARTDFCNYPEQLSSVPSVGGFDGKTLSVETIVSYKPDFVYGSKGMHDFLEPLLKNFGIELYLSDAQSISSVLDEIVYIGKVTGNEKKGLELKKQIENGIKKIKKGKKVSVYWEVWNAPYMSAGGPSFINDVIKVAGGNNIFSDVDQAYPMVSEESIIARNPDVILIPSDTFISAEDVSKRNGWKNIKAVKNSRIFIIDADVFTRPGPRILEAVTTLNDYLNTK